jgi:hypothetical protein
MDVDLTDGSTNARIMLKMVDTVEQNDIRELVIAPNTTYNAFILTNYSFTLAKPNTNGFIIDDKKAGEISNLIGLVHVAKQTQALPIGEPLGSLDILSRTCLGPMYICYYCLYNDYNDGSNYVVALSRESQTKGKMWMFRHKEVDDKTNASEYILISSVWGPDSWIQTLGFNNESFRQVSVGSSFANTRTYVFQDARNKYIVYSSDPGTVAAPQNTQVQPVAAPPAAPPPAMMGAAATFQVASSNTQTVPSNDSILEALKSDVRRYLDAHSSNHTNKTWYPYKVHGVMALNNNRSPVLFKDRKPVNADNGSVTKVENRGIDKISQIAGSTIRNAILENSTPKNSVEILSEIFSTSSSTDQGPTRSYVVFEVTDNRGTNWNVVGTYTNVHLHTRAQSGTSINTALVDRSIDQESPESVQFSSTPQMPNMSISGSVVQTTQVTQVSDTMNTQQPPQQQPRQPQQPQQPLQPQVQQPQQPQVQQPPEQLPVQQPVQQQLPFQLPHQVQAIVPAPVPAPSTVPHSGVPPAVPVPPATFPIFPPQNQGAASCTDGSRTSSTDGSPCFTWKFTQWKHAGSVTTSVTTPVLPSSNLEFKISRNQMKQLQVGRVANDDGYTLSFKNNQGTTFPTYIQITSNTSSSSSYSLVAIRPDVRGLENVNMDPQCDAVWITTTGDFFVRCKIEVTDAGDLVPGIYLEWAAPHIDTGRYVKEVNTGNTGSDSNLLYPYDPSAATAMNHGIAADLVPSSVVASYARGSIVPNDLILHRIDGATAHYQQTYIIAAYTEPTNSRGGGVTPLQAAVLGYRDYLEKIRQRYTGRETMNSEYFDGDGYKRNPHFRFIPPWFEGSEAPSILCIGDSLTADDYRVCPNEPYAVDNPPYSKLLEGLLQEVGIRASVENIGVTGAVIWKTIDSFVDIFNSLHQSSYKINPKPHNWSLNEVEEAEKSFSKIYPYQLAIIWLGTNDLSYISNKQLPNAPGGTLTEEQIKEELTLDFERLMRKYRAKHYLLVKVDGPRQEQEVGEPWPGGCAIDASGTISLGTCKRFIKGPYIGETFLDPANTVNNTLLDLEKKYSNVHVTDINYGIDRCPSERNSGYIHFKKKDSIAKSIFGRIMCHAIFHRESGDLRWVGAVPATKLDGAGPFV